MAVAVLVLAALLLSPLAPTAVAAQTNAGEIGGIVRDHLGGALAGASIAARHAESGTIVERVTDAAGRFFLPALRTGVWDVTASLAGFEPRPLTGIVLDLGRSVTLDFVLSVEGLS